jgi:hypothetical protein
VEAQAVTILKEAGGIAFRVDLLEDDLLLLVYTQTFFFGVILLAIFLFCLFSMVNATLQILNYIDRNDINFTHFIHMASTSYPIVGNQRIRNTLAEYPVDANFMHIILKPARPGEAIWNYFVECDDQVHRIHRLPIITKEQNNADIYTSSQWFIISKEFAHYLANPKEEEGIFLRQYLDYIEHAVVADEHFFGTVLRNTHFCNKVGCNKILKALAKTPSISKIAIVVLFLSFCTL